MPPAPMPASGAAYFTAGDDWVVLDTESTPDSLMLKADAISCALEEAS